MGECIQRIISWSQNSSRSSSDSGWCPIQTSGTNINALDTWERYHVPVVLHIPWCISRRFCTLLYIQHIYFCIGSLFSAAGKNVFIHTTMYDVLLQLKYWNNLFYTWYLVLHMIRIISIYYGLDVDRFFNWLGSRIRRRFTNMGSRLL